jgi:polysaccharide export outer membrane protein
MSGRTIPASGAASARHRPFRAIVAGALLLGLSACGVTYQSPSVREGDDDTPVTVVEMTLAAVQQANASPYVPRSLPQAFYAAAGTGSITQAGALPAPPFLPDATRQRLDYRPLPDVAPSPYRIGVGDVLLLATRGNGSTVEQLSGLLAATNQRDGYTVRDDGTIAIPEVGTVALAGLTVEEAEQQVFQVLVANNIDPAFSLEVAEFNSQKVAVGGAVGRPALVPITLNETTLGTALVAAGGITARDREFASIRIYRDGTLYQIPLDIYLEQPNLQKKRLLGGDAVFVDTSYDLDRALTFYRARIDVISLRTTAKSAALAALETEIGLQRNALEERRSNFERRLDLDAEARDYIYLTGEVNTQARVPLPFGQTASLADVLFDEGGFDTTTGDPSQIYVLRSGSGANVVAYHLDARNAAKIVLATRFEMRPDDVVFIEEQPITKWSRSLQQLFPSLLRGVEGAL